MVKNFTVMATFVEDIKYSRNELTIFWDYAKNDIANNNYVKKYSKLLRKHYNDTWLY